MDPESRGHTSVHRYGARKSSRWLRKALPARRLSRPRALFPAKLTCSWACAERRSARGMPESGSWSAAELDGHAIDLFEPARASPHGYVVLYLHNHACQRLADHEPFTREFDRHGLRVIAPQ